MPGAKDKLLEARVALPSGTNSPLFQEAEKLLKMAEELNEKSERTERRLYMYAFMVVTTIFAIFSMLFTFQELFNYPDNPFLVVLIFFYTGTLIAAGSLLVMRVMKRRKRDQRALYEIVDMLRELEHSMMEREQISQLERAEFRIRLSRFDIGPAWERRGFYSKR
jgi:uncharacterized membrane protein YhaH (DUF805 family)